MRRIAPFVLTAIASAVVSSGFTLWVVENMYQDAALAPARIGRLQEKVDDLADRIEKVTFTKAGAFRFPDLSNGPRKVQQHDGREAFVTTTVYR